MNLSVAGVALLAVAVFGLVLSRMRLLRIGRRALTASLTGVTAILDPELSDLQKEKAVRASGGSLLLAAGDFIARFGLGVLAAAAIVFAAEHGQVVDADRVLQCLMRFEFILGVSVAALVGWYVWPRHRTKQDQNLDGADEAQSQADQLIHSLAFASPSLAKAMAALDGWVSSRARQTARDCSLIFVTSLPRAGTTALLNALNSLPQLAAHEYRDMPFIVAPFLWSKLSGRRHVRRQARAHGDGLQIDLDSPEAFDEVLFKLYWPQKYNATKIQLWSARDRGEKQVQRLVRNFETIVALRAIPHRRTKSMGYVSKNNANIARLPFLKSAFPRAHIVIPLRRPGPHAASMLRQHLNFLQRHKEDPFAKRYMRDIGHYEFGALHKSITFPDQAQNPYATSDANYWLFYWVAAFRAIEQHREDCVFVTQDALRSDPQRAMSALAKRLDLNVDGLRFDSFFLRSPAQCDEHEFDPTLLGEAEAIYARLAA